MPRSRMLPFIAAFALTSLVACSNQRQAESTAAADASMAAPAEAVQVPEIAAGAPAAEARMADAKADAPADAVQRPGVTADQLASTASASDAPIDPRRRFVRTADASFQVKDVYASTLAIEDAAAAEGGFVVKNSIGTQVLRNIERPIGGAKLLQLSEVATQGSLVVRVPGDRTQAFLRTIAKQMQFLDARNFEANDVQFELLRRALAQARAQELQQDIRAAAAQPGRIGEKIDAVQAREQMLASRDEQAVAQRELEDRIAFSTLRLELRQPAQVRENIVPDTEAILRERGPGFFSELGQALRAGWRGLLLATVAFAQLWPLWLLVAAAVWGWRALRRWRRRPAGAGMGAAAVHGQGAGEAKP